MKGLKNVRSVNVKGKRELHKRVAVSTLMYGSKAWGMSVEERIKLDVIEMRSLRSMCEATRYDRLRIEEWKGKSRSERKVELMSKLEVIKAVRVSGTHEWGV